MTITDAGRPAPQDRAFVSPVVDAVIADLAATIADEYLAGLFTIGLSNPLDSTVTHTDVPGRPDTFVASGPLPAMGLRDSTMQIWPYLRFAAQDPGLARLIAGVINRQTDQLLLDPYANLFNFDESGARLHKDDTDQHPGVFERKWEVDSVCFPLRLAHAYWRATGDTSPFDGQWRTAVARVISVIAEQQRFAGPGTYRFRRTSNVPEDIAPGGGYGPPARPNGLVRSLFRPSNDAGQLPYNIPANALTTVALRRVAELLQAVDDDATATDALGLADEISIALVRYAVGKPYDDARPILAYEVDGFGSRLYFDDANPPNLLSLPLFGYCADDDPVYLATRERALSSDNPWWVSGSLGSGLGSSHAGQSSIWPLGVIVQALTSRDREEVRRCLATLVALANGTGVLREAVDANRAARYVGAWSPRTNATMGELVLHTADQWPGLLGEPLSADVSQP